MITKTPGTISKFGIGACTRGDERAAELRPRCALGRRRRRRRPCQSWPGTCARPDPVPPFIEEGPKELGYGAPKHYVVEVQLPVEGSPEGYQWHQIGGPRMLGVAMGASQDLFEEQYEGKRAVRIMGVCDVYERARDGVAVATGGVTLELHSIKFP